MAANIIRLLLDQLNSVKVRIWAFIRINVSTVGILIVCATTILLTLLIHPGAVEQLPKLVAVLAGKPEAGPPSSALRPREVEHQQSEVPKLPAPKTEEAVVLPTPSPESPVEEYIPMPPPASSRKESGVRKSVRQVPKAPAPPLVRPTTPATSPIQIAKADLFPLPETRRPDPWSGRNTLSLPDVTLVVPVHACWRPAQDGNLPCVDISVEATSKHRAIWGGTPIGTTTQPWVLRKLVDHGTSDAQVYLCSPSDKFDSTSFRRGEVPVHCVLLPGSGTR